MRIVLFNKQEKSGGGIGVFTERFKAFAESKGHEVFELRYSKEEGKKKFIKIPYVFADRHTVVLVPAFDSKTVIIKALKKIKPDIVYLPIGISVLDFIVPSICTKMGIPTFGVSHKDISHTSRISRSLTSFPFKLHIPLIKKLDKLQVFSERLKEFLIKKGVDGNKIVVIPNGVDLKKYSPGKSAFAKELKGKTGILFLGRIGWEKNPEVVIKSFLKVANKKAVLIFVGTGNLEEKLRSRYESKNIIFLGSITDEKRKIDVIRGCEVFVLPSAFEGMSLSLLEAMATGLCCIASDAASQREMLEGCGIVIPLNKLKSTLPTMLAKVLRDAKLRKKLGKKARSEAIRKYSQSLVFKTAISEFDKLILDK